MPEIPLHRFVIHFPIALSVFALLYDVRAMVSKRPSLHETGYGLSLWAGASAAMAVVTGLQIAGLGQIGKGAVTGHALFGMLSTITLAAFALLRYSSRARMEDPDENYSVLKLVVEVAAVVFVLITAVTGHGLV